ncbi:hypothetical protein GRI40_08910 [Altererythrobacter aerius]|uniref:Uncharacterized protein n=1 Tax=Tsuneonella aeria TaxID=1837929 RepID=A0A6I4TDF0_9SPHN|nr:hypothetical protein [Tsuneonella aeria]MXO75331.1 hypothetical protein [Tsuneonella aeria]
MFDWSAGTSGGSVAAPLSSLHSNATSRGLFAPAAPGSKDFAECSGSGALVPTFPALGAGEGVSFPRRRESAPASNIDSRRACRPLVTPSALTLQYRSGQIFRDNVRIGRECMSSRCRANQETAENPSFLHWRTRQDHNCLFAIIRHQPRFPLCSLLIPHSRFAFVR